MLGLAAAAIAATGASAATAAPASLTVDARAGQVSKAAAGLRRTGLRVQRREGRRLQVVADASRVSSLERIPGVAGARVASAPFADAAAETQGLWRSGADVLGRVAGGGRGVTIAVLDLGFGAGMARLQALGELPPPGRIETLSFDAAHGLAGANAYGNRTNHGEIVAQTVYDYAPEARYLFVNYHTEADFLAATEAIIARRPDIVVHSNSFLEGPFDGTGPMARAVDRAAGAGILWFNSAGNYGLLHWEGTWADADADGDLDWPNGDTWTFTSGAGQPISLALSWTSPPGGVPTDLDLILERQQPDGTWAPAMGSVDRQSAGLPTAERITGYAPSIEGVYRLRVVHVSGPPPDGRITLFSREVRTQDIGGTIEDSIPTPGDAAGSITVGAVDWRGNALKSYSSQGPTDDGRLKPDVVAPTNTQIMGPNGLRAVGGTSNSAPNAAGAAAVMLAAARRAGGNPSAAEIRGQLDALALDLGPPGPDVAYGWGRVRVSLDPPRIGRLRPARLASIRKRATVKFTGLTRSRLTSWTLTVRRCARGRASPEVSARHHHRHAPPGPGVAPPARPDPGCPGQSRRPGVAGVRGQHPPAPRGQAGGPGEEGQEAPRRLAARRRPRQGRRGQAQGHRHDLVGLRPAPGQALEPGRARAAATGAARPPRRGPLPRAGRPRGPGGQHRQGEPSHPGEVIG